MILRNENTLYINWICKYLGAYVIRMLLQQKSINTKWFPCVDKGQNWTKKCRKCTSVTKTIEPIESEKGYRSTGKNDTAKWIKKGYKIAIHILALVIEKTNLINPGKKWDCTRNMKSTSLVSISINLIWNVINCTEIRPVVVEFSAYCSVKGNVSGMHWKVL